MVTRYIYIYICLELFGLFVAFLLCLCRQSCLELSYETSGLVMMRGTQKHSTFGLDGFPVDANG